MIWIDKVGIIALSAITGVAISVTTRNSLWWIVAVGIGATLMIITDAICTAIREGKG